MTSLMTCRGLAVPVPGDHPGVLVLDLGPAVPELFHEHGHGLQDVERLEPGADQRLAVDGGDES